MTISYRIYFILKVLEYFIYNTLQDKIYKDYKIVIIFFFNLLQPYPNFQKIYYVSI